MTEEELQDIADTYGLYTQIDIDNFTKELKSQIEKIKCCKSEILQRIDESCIGALNEEVRAIFKKWELAE